MTMSLRGASNGECIRPSKHSPVALGGCFATCARSDMQRIETERINVHGNRELVRLYEGKVVVDPKSWTKKTSC